MGIKQKVLGPMEGELTLLVVSPKMKNQLEDSLCHFGAAAPVGAWSHAKAPA